MGVARIDWNCIHKTNFRSMIKCHDCPGLYVKNIQWESRNHWKLEFWQHLDIVQSKFLRLRIHFRNQIALTKQLFGSCEARNLTGSVSVQRSSRHKLLRPYNLPPREQKLFSQRYPIQNWIVSHNKFDLTISIFLWFIRFPLDFKFWYFHPRVLDSHGSHFWFGHS